MRRLLLLLVVLIAQTPSLFPAQRKEPASKRELTEISERGKQLFAYDTATTHARNAVLALKPDEGTFSQYVGRLQGDRWVVAFGRLTEKRDKFLIAYEAVQGASPTEFNVNTYKPPREDSGFFLNAAKAIAIAMADFKGESRPYNTEVLPAPKDRVYVYLMPTQTKEGTYPQSGDVRYLMSKDGSSIVERRQMHDAIRDIAAQPGTEAGFHIALNNVPEDTDVFHVLARKPSAPEWILASKFVYVIRPDASVDYLMTAEAFMKLQKTVPR